MPNLKDLLKKYLNEKEIALAPRSFDIIGNREKAVAIVQIPEELESKKKLIAELITKLNKNVKTVLRKLSGRVGKYRLNRFEILLGNSNTEVIHKEFGYYLKLDPTKVFFSPREATERQRVASQVQPGEKVLVMFSGVAPYIVAIVKKQPSVEKVYGIDINPDAHRYALENARMNKISHKVILVNGDVREVMPKMKEKFDRIVMPLSREGYMYLDLAFDKIKNGGIIHFYYAPAPEEDLFSKAEEIVRKVAKEKGKDVEIIHKVRVLPYGSRSWKICLDIKVFDRTS